MRVLEIMCSVGDKSHVGLALARRQLTAGGPSSHQLRAGSIHVLLNAHLPLGGHHPHILAQWTE